MSKFSKHRALPNRPAALLLASGAALAGFVAVITAEALTAPKSVAGPLEVTETIRQEYFEAGPAWTGRAAGPHPGLTPHEAAESAGYPLF